MKPHSISYTKSCFPTVCYQAPAVGTQETFGPVLMLHTHAAFINDIRVSMQPS